MHVVSSSGTLSTSFEARLGYTGWPAKPKGSLVSTSLILGLQLCVLMPSIYMGFGDKIQVSMFAKTNTLLAGTISDTISYSLG